jgi:hypothetical protein
MADKQMKSALIIFLIMICCYQVPAQTAPYKIPVVVVKYYPVKGDSIDRSVTGDYGEAFAKTKAKVDSITPLIVKTLEKGSTYHGYKDAASTPSLDYEILKEYEYTEPLPVYDKKGHKTPMTDYRKILESIGAEEWVNKKGVKEFWLWGYHGGVVDLWESNMSGKYGDVSNSDRDENDLPVYNTTYTVYHYNYQRGLSETIENHMHQVEALLNHFDGRDTTAEEDWDKLLFWGKFVGSDASHKIINPRCGWAHYPPNGEKDYDWKNKKFVLTDIENWNPDGTGEKININCEKWNCNSLDWFVYWMQSIPGKDNGLKYNGKALNNWWLFIGDFDFAKQNKLTLTKE